MKKIKKGRRHIKAKTTKVCNKTSNVISMEFCVYVCVYVPRQRGKKGENEREREREKKIKRPASIQLIKKKRKKN